MIPIIIIIVIFICWLMNPEVLIYNKDGMIWSYAS